jgi:hypothetical protein
MALPGGSLIKTLVYHFVLVSFFIVENAEICNLSHISSNMRASVLWSQSGYVSEGSSAQLQNILSLVTSSLGNQSTLPTCQFIIIKKASYSHCIKGCLELYVKLWPIIHIFKYQNLHSIYSIFHLRSPKAYPSSNLAFYNAPAHIRHKAVVGSSCIIP